MKTETQNLFRVAIVGAASLKGKELKDVLEERNFPAADIKLLDDDESLGQLERVQDEVALVQPVGRDELAKMDFTFFASEARIHPHATGSWRAKPAARSSTCHTRWKTSRTFP